MDETITSVIEMIQQYPDLPVICMVSSEVGAEDSWSRWLAKVGDVYRAKIWIGEERVYFYNERGVDEDAINDPDCIYPEMELTEERAKEVYDGLPWEECIVLKAVSQSMGTALKSGSSTAKGLKAGFDGAIGFTEKKFTTFLSNPKEEPL